ncbi:phosphate ABC transporter ATP-binding protein, PhoT family [Pelagirhabdus alkalitolerans]|uniref:Phosphate ABC transporter ATP-binding protein, PhoT family n=1 Tax=Pelagirhabdus alkalitolerans TaxID=1612202 RepID=A0A1G6HRN4_9BACI|nr:phosphate ABC transporter ATP-binding protein PstB [Pelagirhabdus alkalitolerans]SDB96871.1 phosphate ABC transporter ATP-binding protein, PhoT family [Pelagirhabdus alkalitolerans]
MLKIVPNEQTTNKQEPNKQLDPIFETKDLNLWYGEDQALKNINLSIDKQNVTAIIGPSGCGKSTFLKTLNRMVELVPSVKTKGEINYQGVNIFDEKINLVELRSSIGMVFQKPNPFPKSIYDNIAFGPRVHGKKNKKEIDALVEKSLKGSGLWDEVKDRLGDSALSLSGGQQQRLCIARTLAIQPDVILMDEPTSALDPKSTLIIEELIQELKQNYSIIIVTHNMQQAARVSDHTAFFLNGEVIEFGQTDTLFQAPTDKRTEDYITGRFG